ncbi:MAG: UDP-N-acetylmuramoyl-L-alanyl-D-glutamate--2,6-diaminopimelate ligase, partial [Lewinella sp.]|nr:UDP-N-acetylmuramoyl-L-alanyl-D-glutamate--2,6-diaminopimelate ligase [Lewinella sp.]
RAPLAEETGYSTWIEVANSARALAQLAAAFYGHPSRELQLVGVTGTNGKTTVATLLYQLFMGLGYKTGLLSTVENRIGEQRLAATHTTPDAVQLNATLAAMREAGCDYAFMEVSSHALDQERVAGLQFAGGIFTNMSHDHLDYHGTFRAYIDAKKKLFDELPAGAFALVNIDDKRGDVMLQNTAAHPYRYSLRTMADFRCRLLDNAISGLHLEMDGHEVFMRLIGGFNAYNLLAVYAAARLLEQPAEEVLTVLSQVPGPEGRLSLVQDPQGAITAVVDYAHTPDALEKVLTTLRETKARAQRLITVVGCGGDRDRTKRPVMARIAAQLSEELILTSDNPRTEDPERILDEMEAGLDAPLKKHTLRITQRRAAIQTACRLARAGDVILVAGKGHEKYQEINGVRHPFDDVVELQHALAQAAV